MALAGWDNDKKVKMVVGDGMLPSALSDFTAPVLLGAESGLSNYDLSSLFSDLGSDYTKIAMEVGDTGEQVPIGLVDADWDSDNSLATIYPDFSDLADASVFYFYWDPTHPDNAVIDGSDDFTTFDDERWVTTTPTVTDFFEHDAASGLLHFAYDSASTATYRLSTEDTFWVEGDYDVQIDWGVDVLNGTDHSAPVQFYAYSQDDSFFAHIQRYRSANYNGDYLSLDGSTSYYATGLYEGKYRFTRTGTTYTIQTWSGSAWVVRKTGTDSGGGRHHFRLGASQVAGCAIDSWIDNFTVNSADAIGGTWVDENQGYVTVLTSAPSAPADGDELTVWNLAAADALFVFYNALRAMVDQFYDLTPYLVRMLLDQVYPLTEAHRTLVDQVYSLRLLAMLKQLYGDVPVRRARLVQLWGSAQTLRVRLEQRYGDSARFRAALDQFYSLNEGLRALCDQPWSVASMPLRVLLDQLYASLDRDQLRAALEQLYVLAAGEAVVQRVDVSVAVDGAEVFSYHNINEEQDESLYYMTAEIQLADQAEYLACKRLSSVVEITVDGEVSRYLVAEPRSIRTENGAAYVVPLVSETILLGHAESGLAVAAEQNWSGMRKALVEELAAPFTVDWRLPNTFLPANILYTNGRSRIELIREVVRSLGGIVQTSPAGKLVCRPEYPHSVNTWSDAEPDVELTDQDDFFQITGQPSSRPGYDRYFLSNNEVSGDDLRIEVEEVSSREQLVQVTPVPWSDGVVLHHSGGAWVQVVVDGVVWLQVAEQVEFVEGAGRVSKPVHGQLSVSWRQRDLGEVTAAEDGELNSELADNSLAWIEYQTRAVQFRVLSDRNENVQVYLEVLQ